MAPLVALSWRSMLDVVYSRTFVRPVLLCSTRNSPPAFLFKTHLKNITSPSNALLIRTISRAFLHNGCIIWTNVFETNVRQIILRTSATLMRSAISSIRLLGQGMAVIHDCNIRHNHTVRQSQSNKGNLKKSVGQNLS